VFVGGQIVGPLPSRKRGTDYLILERMMYKDIVYSSCFLVRSYSDLDSARSYSDLGTILL